MAKASFGEYAAFTVRNDIRFQKVVNGKKQLIKEAEVPAEVADLLRKNVLGTATVPQAQPELPQELPGALEAALPVNAPADEKTLAPPSRPNIPGIVGYVSEPKVEPADSRDRQALMQENDQLKTVISNMDSFAIHTADIKDIAQALFDRFGIYTVWLGRFPEPDEVNPFTGEPMSNYERGVAYQAAIRAQARGLVNPEQHRAQMKANEAALHQVTYAPQPQTFEDHRERNSFEYRTSVEGERDRASGTISVKNPDDDSDPIAEPQMGKQVIRPNW